MGALNIFIALLAAIGVGAIISAVVGHRTTISGFRQAWINALRDDLAEFVWALEKMNYTIADYLTDSKLYENDRREARTVLMFVYERIRMRLNKDEELHVALESKLREFLDKPLGEMMADRTEINHLVDLARRLLKHEWKVTKRL